MSTRTPGAPTQASQAAMRANAEYGAANQTKKYMWQLPYNAHTVSSEYPIVPVARDQYDDVANIKGQFATGMGADSKWVVPFSSEDASYVRRKRDAEEKAEFDAWVMQKWDITDPSQNLMLQGIAPELFQRREEVIDANQELVSRYAKLRLRGPKSLQDLQFEWLIETGRMDLPKGPIWDPKAWREAQYGLPTTGANAAANALALDSKTNQDRYRYGLFSPVPWLTQATAGWQRSGTNPADIRGDSARKAYDITNVPYPDAANANWWGGYPTVYPNAGGNTILKEDAAPDKKKAVYNATAAQTVIP